MGKVEGSGIQKGYRYDKPMSVDHAEAISKSLRGRNVSWGDAISKARKEMNTSDILKNRWRDTPRNWMIINVRTGVVDYSENLKVYCKAKGFADSHLNRISMWHRGKPLGGQRYYRGVYDCINLDHPIVDRTGTDEDYFVQTYVIRDRLTGNQWHTDNLKGFCREHELSYSSLSKQARKASKEEEIIIRKNTPRFIGWKLNEPFLGDKDEKDY